MSDAERDRLAQFRAVGFPLKIYARAVELEEGRPDDGHYGLYETPDLPSAAARRYSSDMLWRHLPPPCRLLKIGVGSGVTLAQLVAAGYAATGITPDAEELIHARRHQGPALPAVCCDLQDFTVDEGSWDALLFQDSAQHFDLLDLLTHSARLASEAGEIIVLDEFALRRIKPGREKLHLLQHFIALAARFGFAVNEQLDLTRQVLAAIDHRIDILSRHAETLGRDFGISREAFDTVSAADITKRSEYAAGRYGYFFIKLRRVSRPRWRVARVDGRHAHAMRALFAEVFHHPMSEAHWQWKYGEERAVAVGVWEGDRLIAHYGGVTRNILFFGEPHPAAQSCDIMVAPAGRTTLSRRGPLFLAASTYIETQIGYGNSYLLGVGFPNLRHWKAAERLGLYGPPVGRILELSWTVARGWPSPTLTLQTLDLNDPHARVEADACWTAMRADVGAMIVGVRDADTLRHRYTMHPDKSYLFVIVRRRFSGRPLGLFVLNPQATEGCELMDVVGALAAIPCLVAQARRTAARLGAGRLFAWVMDNIQSYFGKDAVVRDVNISVPSNAWTAGPPVEAQIGKWWLTSGDTDSR